MIDMTLCLNEGCPLKAVCYRSAVHHGVLDHQSVARFSINDDGKCDHFVQKYCTDLSQKLPRKRDKKETP